MALKIGSLNSTSSFSLKNFPKSSLSTTRPSFEPYLKRAMESLKTNKIEGAPFGNVYESMVGNEKIASRATGLQPGKVYVYKPEISVDRNGFNYYLDAIQKFFE